jgi:hypothetical protein
MKNITIYSIVFTFAAALISSFVNRSTAFKAAWVLAKITFSKNVTFSFLKGDGTFRTATAIEGIVNLEKNYVRFLEVDFDGVQKYRSFNIDKLIFAS